MWTHYPVHGKDNTVRTTVTSEGALNLESVMLPTFLLFKALWQFNHFCSQRSTKVFDGDCIESLANLEPFSHFVHLKPSDQCLFVFIFCLYFFSFLNWYLAVFSVKLISFALVKYFGCHVCVGAAEALIVASP